MRHLNCHLPWCNSSTAFKIFSVRNSTIAYYLKLPENVPLSPYAFFEIGRKNDKEKKKNMNKKNVSHTWIRTTLRQANGLNESLLDHWAPTYCILHYSNLHIYQLPVIVIAWSLRQSSELLITPVWFTINQSLYLYMFRERLYSLLNIMSLVKN